MAGIELQHMSRRLCSQVGILSVNSLGARIGDFGTKKSHWLTHEVSWSAILTMGSYFIPFDVIFLGNQVQEVHTMLQKLIRFRELDPMCPE